MDPGVQTVSLPTVCFLGSKVISHLLLTEPAPLAASHDDSTNDSSLRTLLTLCDLLNRELLVLIGWAKQIPGTHRNCFSEPHEFNFNSILNVDDSIFKMS